MYIYGMGFSDWECMILMKRNKSMLQEILRRLDNIEHRLDNIRSIPRNNNSYLPKPPTPPRPAPRIVTEGRRPENR